MFVLLQRTPAFSPHRQLAGSAIPVVWEELQYRGFLLDDRYCRARFMIIAYDSMIRGFICVRIHLGAAAGCSRIFSFRALQWKFTVVRDQQCLLIFR